MKVQDYLQVVPGTTPVVGSGGKTSLIALLASELPGTSVLCTTTRIFPFDGVRCLEDAAPTEAARALRSQRTVCVGLPAESGKLAEPSCGVKAFESVADHVLVEADGSKRLPLKAHCPWEPVIPDGARPAILVVGASGFDLPVAQAVHRPNAFCALVGGCPWDVATPERVARVVAAENLAATVFVNQVDPDDSDALQAARQFATALREQGYTGRIGAGSVRKNWALEL